MARREDIKIGRYITFNKKGKGYKRQLHGKIVDVVGPYFVVDFGKYRESFLFADLGVDIINWEITDRPRPAVVKGEVDAV